MAGEGGDVIIIIIIIIIIIWRCGRAPCTTVTASAERKNQWRQTVPMQMERLLCAREQN